MDKHNAQLASIQKPPNSDNDQDRQGSTKDNTPKTYKKMQVQAQKWPRKQQTNRKIDQKSDWSGSIDGKDDQARARPVAVDFSLNYETDMDQKPSTFQSNTSVSLRRQNIWPDV